MLGETKSIFEWTIDFFFHNMLIIQLWSRRATTTLSYTNIL